MSTGAVSEPQTPSPPAPINRLSSRRQALLAGLIIASLLLSTLSFALSALPLAALLILAWDRWGKLPRPAGTWLVAFLGMALLSTPWVTDGWTHLIGLANLYGLWFVYWRIVAGIPWTAAQRAGFWRGLAVTGCLLATIGLANVLGASGGLQWGELPWAPGSFWLDLQLTTTFQRASGWSMNPNVLAALLLLTWPVSLWLAARATERRARLGWLAALLLQWSVLLLSQSRGAVIASGAVALTWLWRDRAVRRALLPAGMALAAMVALSLPAWQPLIERLETVANPDHSSNSIRISLVRSGLEMVRDYPLQGMGIWSYAEQYPRYQYPEDTANCPHLHNWYLQVASESGLPGAMVLFTAIGMIAWRARRQGSVVAETTLAFALFSVTDYLFHDARVALVAWTLWGMASQPEANSLTASRQTEITSPSSGA